jgi:hypothetical protein
VPAGDDRRVGLGLYPLGPVANVSPRPRPVRRDGLLETVVLPIAERDVNGNGTFDPVENWNGSWTKIGGVQVRALDTYEDTGPDGLLSRDEPGYDLVLNPDPAGDDFDPVLNPSGPEGNGRLDRREDQNGDFYLCVPDLQLDEDRNSNGLLDGPERDLNGNNLISHRRIRIADRPPLSLSIGQNEDPADPNVNPVYPSPRDPVRSLGYSLVVRRPSDASIYVFRIMIYRSFLEARVSFSQATPLRHLLVSTPEVGDRARNLEDDDRDGIIDDGPDHPFGSPELTLDGIDDDGDGVIDDGLLLPTHVHTFVLRVESGTGVGAPGDPR